jgi:hypothetical protein
MSFLSKILGAKKAADTHRKASLPAPAPANTPSEPPYRHIPTHALSDSLNLGASLPSPDLHERIREENRRHSLRPPSLRRTGSDTFLDHRSGLARKRSERELARLARSQASGEGEFRVGGTVGVKGKGKVNMTLPMPPPPTSNPYAMPAELQRPKNGGPRRVAVGSAKNNPVPSMRSARSPFAESIAGEWCPTRPHIGRY